MSASSIISPGATIGIVGGGQLGRMLAQAARRFGYQVVVLTGGAKDTPAGAIADDEIAAGFSDEQAIARFVAAVDVITWEFENVDIGLAEVAAEAGVPVRPSASIVAMAQDRELEKLALERAGVEVAPWRAASTSDQLESAIDELGLSVVLKLARFGYDGKGQARADVRNDVDKAWTALGRGRVVIESLVQFRRELSVVVARSATGEVVHHGVMQNHHVDHVLDTTVVPARVSSATSHAAIAIAHLLAHQFDLVGVMCVELFDTDDGLIVNEVAPRPHNSGHLTIEAAVSSQFEQQLRAICGLPLGDGSCRPAAMVQLLGDLWSDGELCWSEALAHREIHLHLYGKAEARPGRKMGHLTCVDDDPTIALQRVVDARLALGGR